MICETKTRKYQQRLGKELVKALEPYFDFKIARESVHEFNKLVTAFAVNLTKIYLKKQKPNCGHHPLACVRGDGAGASSRRMEGLDWAFFCDIVNEVADRLNLSVNIYHTSDASCRWLRGELGILSKLYFRKDGRRRVRWPCATRFILPADLDCVRPRALKIGAPYKLMIAGIMWSGYLFNYWTAGRASDFADCRNKLAPITQVPEGTPGGDPWFAEGRQLAPLPVDFTRPAGVSKLRAISRLCDSLAS